MEKQSDKSEECRDYDAIVVGSGYGGSVAACRMSMAGIKVCLIEKGRRWEAHEFPKDSLSLISATRVEWRRWGFGLGSKQALFQMHDQGDSLAVVACGLGGGSLVNAGVMVPTPVRARRDPKWPKEWHKDWEVYQQYASEMLDAQNVPVEFPNARVMKQIVDEEIEDCRPDPIKLSINFGRESEQKSSCLACGNCLSGCPYNAKNSTDKNYLATAMQKGCVMKTSHKVLYVLKNQDLYFEKCNGIERQQRRWRVYFDDQEYISADFVVLSAGVLGTAEILFQSRKRGLNLSKSLGLGLSCNGNNVAYVSGGQAPLHANGLDRNQVLGIPFQNRPGPSISSSYTSSLGFTIQSGVLAISYPCVLIKGILTYRWPHDPWFFYGLFDKLKHLMGFNARHGVVLNAMGYDASDGVITLDEETEKLHLTPPNDSLLLKKIQACQNLAKRLGGILFMSRYRSTSVHLLGGCNAASDPSHGVCNPEGQVFNPTNNQAMIHDGLYVCDASLIPCSVGINPCLTIAIVGEHVSGNLVQDVIRFRNMFKQMNVEGNIEDQETIKQGYKSTELLSFTTGKNPNVENFIMRPCDIVTVKETMQGFVGGMPCTAYFVMRMNIGEADKLLKGRISGYVVFQAISKDRLFIVDGSVDMCRLNSITPYTQYMQYKMILASASGSRYILEGRKIMNPYLLASNIWKESTTLYVTFTALPPHDHMVHKGHNNMNDEQVSLQGELHITLFELLKSFVRLEGKQRGIFVSLLLKSLWRTYVLQVPRHREDSLNMMNITHNPYPVSTLHELETGDGHKISCRQWSCHARKHEENRHIVLLLNAYTTESFYLPSEDNDLVRTLLGEGYETWLLQSRAHPLHPSNDFTIEDIGKFDIPSVIKQILELNGQHTKIHIIAHCVGGLAVHISLLGGHISASHIASLSCVNSSMFFKLTTSALVKMWLPLVPVTMAIMGKNRILSMYAEKDSYRHQIVKFIARLIPRNDRCTCNVCEIISGIFGNPYWHENVSHTLHQWLNKQSVATLPLSAFPHLRKIATTGFIVDPHGKNNYLIHPERMPIPTLYLSGGRSLLATPETSLLANKYMKLHQPGFHHKRVVVDGFGHSDVLIGVESYKKVFPHFLSHMRLAETGERNERSAKSKEAMVSWDGFDVGIEGFGYWTFSNLMILLFFLAVVVVFFC